jgi:hypothetical protein
VIAATSTEVRGLRAAGRHGGGRRVLSDRLAAGVVDRLYREHFGRAVAALIRALGDWDLAEETVQDAPGDRSAAARARAA